MLKYTKYTKCALILLCCAALDLPRNKRNSHLRDIYYLKENYFSMFALLLFYNQKKKVGYSESDKSFIFFGLSYQDLLLMKNFAISIGDQARYERIYLSGIKETSF